MRDMVKGHDFMYTDKVGSFFYGSAAGTCEYTWLFLGCVSDMWFYVDEQGVICRCDNGYFPRSFWRLTEP